MKSEVFSNLTLVFDLDGTLVDTAPDLIRALNETLAIAGCPPMAQEQALPFISFGGRRMIVEGLKAGGMAHDDARLEPLLAHFLDYYAGNIAVESRPYMGATELLRAAAQAGAKLGVCTNKREKLANLLLSELALDAHFGAILGFDTLEVHKPDPRHLTETIVRAGGTSGKAIMVGDSATDVATARAAGIPVIAVSFGYSDVPAHALGADAVIDHYRDLPAAAEVLLSR